MANSAEKVDQDSRVGGEGEENSWDRREHARLITCLSAYFNICAVPLFYLVSSSYFWKAWGGRAHELTNARFWASSYNGSHHFRPYD